MAEKSVTIREGASLLLQQLADRPMEEWAALVEMALLAAKSCGVEEVLVMIQLARSGYIGGYHIADLPPMVSQLKSTYEIEIRGLKDDLRYMRQRHVG